MLSQVSISASGEHLFQLGGINDCIDINKAITETLCARYIRESDLRALQKIRYRNDVAEIVFFDPKFPKYFDNHEILENEYQIRDLIPADLFLLCRMNKIIEYLLEETPHVTHFRNARKEWVCASFSKLNGARWIFVNGMPISWHGTSTFAGVRKSCVQESILIVS